MSLSTRSASAMREHKATQDQAGHPAKRAANGAELTIAKLHEELDTLGVKIHQNVKCVRCLEIDVVVQTHRLPSCVSVLLLFGCVDGKSDCQVKMFILLKD